MLCRLNLILCMTVTTDMGLKTMPVLWISMTKSNMTIIIEHLLTIPDDSEAVGEGENSKGVGADSEGACVAGLAADYVGEDSEGVAAD